MKTFPVPNDVPIIDFLNLEDIYVYNHIRLFRQLEMLNILIINIKKFLHF